jgi:serine-type D-Ala-D-Ala carboxypeptidase/endopeptidase (penicillin-binding protein 4)
MNMRHLLLWITLTVSAIPAMSQSGSGQKKNPAPKVAKDSTPKASSVKGSANLSKLDEALHILLADAQMKHALVGMYVKEASSGKVVKEINGQIGFAPASCQKVIVSTASLELLGEDFQYQTRIGYDGSIQQGTLQGNLYVICSGDPSLGSWRYEGSKPEQVMGAIHGILLKAGITHIAGNILLDDHQFSLQPVPGGWVWEDLGNYYGAGAQGLNWHENQYDLDLQPGAKVGDTANILDTRPDLEGDTLLNGILTGPKGSPDESNIYFPPLSHIGYTSGTIPQGTSTFTVAGSLPDPGKIFGAELMRQCKGWNIQVDGRVMSNLDYLKNHQPFPAYTNVCGSIPSPALDSLVYWFLKKSINLYGEALVRTLSLQKNPIASTDKGVTIVRDFWAKNGIDPTALHIQDGSGLSPQNRVTPFALVQVLEFAKSKPWFPAFYDALPLIDGITMKSGSIGGARAYAGYVGGKDGKQYTFAFIINNYDGSGSEIQHKMWKVLDQLKP